MLEYVGLRWGFFGCGGYRFTGSLAWVVRQKLFCDFLQQKMRHINEFCDKIQGENGYFTPT
jgi:hypothetical protein